MSLDVFYQLEILFLLIMSDFAKLLEIENSSDESVFKVNILLLQISLSLAL